MLDDVGMNRARVSLQEALLEICSLFDQAFALSGDNFLALQVESNDFLRHAELQVFDFASQEHCFTVDWLQELPIVGSDAPGVGDLFSGRHGTGRLREWI